MVLEKPESRAREAGTTVVPFACAARAVRLHDIIKSQILDLLILFSFMVDSCQMCKENPLLISVFNIEAPPLIELVLKYDLLNGNINRVTAIRLAGANGLRSARVVMIELDRHLFPTQVCTQHHRVCCFACVGGPIAKISG